MNVPQPSRLSLDTPQTGVSIPISAIRTAAGCGTGEFLDLPTLGSWCAKAGLSLIQILPVNDTGPLPSPYSAVSAFALHPIYIRLQALPGAERVNDAIERLRRDYEHGRTQHEAVLARKLTILRALFDADDRRELAMWIDERSWIKTYAVYKCLKSRFDETSWVDWPAHRDPSEDDINALWSEFGDDALFQAWVQYHLEHQFRSAVHALADSGIAIKGDIPILMNIDSADVWANRSYFDLEYGAGAPPDVFTRLGQTWGFPIYNWDVLKADDYSWWTRRLRAAAMFYNAYRIDHVIGFFRIWSSPSIEESAMMGHYRPSAPVSMSDLRAAGLSDDEIDRLVSGWTTEKDGIRELGEAWPGVRETYFESAGGGSRLRLLSDYYGERAVTAINESDQIKSFLLACHRSRAMVLVDKDFLPAWYWDESVGIKSLDDEATERFRVLVQDYLERSQPGWMALGRANLNAICRATTMLACAEDLGAVPDGLREVLAELGILSLKIERWEEDDAGSLIAPADFLHLSVSTPGVHDISTIRGWWEEGDWDRDGYWTLLGLDGDCPDYLTVAAAEAIIGRSLTSGSAVVMIQIQDLFALTYPLRMDPPDAERINIPGTIAESNWSYRMPVTVEWLLHDGDLAMTIHRLIAKNRP